MTHSPLLMPHAVCWAAAPHLVWTMVIANFLIFAAYVAICGALLFIARKTLKVMPRDWIFFVVGFALFIVACGSTHLMDVVTTWIPVFWIDATTVIITAVLSVYVALQLIRRAPHVAFAINDYAKRLASTEHEKDAMRDKLLAARKMEDWSRMSAVISHEISNPLEAIQNLLYLIQSTPGAAAETSDLAHQAEEEVRRVIEISKSTLSFHRESTRPELVNLKHVTQSVRYLLDRLIHERGIDFRIHGDGDFEIEAFPGETRQVILNLARNACEAIAEPGRSVTLTLTHAGEGVELQVADQGTGIDPKVLPTLFDFGRSTKGEAGNGIGLWTVKQLVTRHGGTIHVDDNCRNGARFSVWWPLKCLVQVEEEIPVAAD